MRREEKEIREVEMNTSTCVVNNLTERAGQHLSPYMASRVARDLLGGLVEALDLRGKFYKCSIRIYYSSLSLYE